MPKITDSFLCSKHQARPVTETDTERCRYFDCDKDAAEALATYKVLDFVQ